MAWRAWDAVQGFQDAQDATGRVLDSISSVDEDDGGSDSLSPDPTDPTKFFSEKDSTFGDAITYAGIVAVLYLVAKAWGELAKLP
jgi:hypothetical protein